MRSFSTLKLGAIYCRRMKMKTGVKTLETAVIYDIMNKTCCMVDWNDPGSGAFALYFRPYLRTFDSLNAPAPGNLPSMSKKGKFPGVYLGGGLELTYAFFFKFYFINPTHGPYWFCGFFDILMIIISLPSKLG